MWPRRNPVDVARDWHWAGASVPVRRRRVDDPDLPAELVVCGRWRKAEVSLRGGGVRHLTCDSDHAFLAFDPETPYGRLYLVLPASVRATVRDVLFDPSGDVVPLQQLARHVGGRQQGGYPDVEVQPIGRVDQVEYWAKKYGNGQGAEDGATFFHAHSRHPTPWLAVDEYGRAWYAGGDYDASDLRGIVG